MAIREDNDPQEGPAIECLTAREKDVLRLLLKHGYAKAVAAELGISTRTVENHLARAREKLGVESTLQAASLLRESELADAAPPPETIIIERRLRRGTTVAIVCASVLLLVGGLWLGHSLFSGPRTMPDFRGRPWATARQQFEALAGTNSVINIGPAGHDPSDKRPTVIFDQVPQPGTPLKPDTLVAAWVGFEKPSSDFDEWFRDARLPRDWTRSNGVGTANVTTARRLRYTLDGDTSHTGSTGATCVSRPLVGRHWTLETKVHYWLPPGKGRQLYLRVVFGRPEWTTACAVEWVRNTDIGTKSRDHDNQQFEAGETGTHRLGGVVYPSMSDTVIIRITRTGQTVVMTALPEGGSPATRAFTFRTPLPHLQELVLTGASFESYGGWAEYEYFRFHALPEPPPHR